MALAPVRRLPTGNARQNPTPTAEDLIAGHKQLVEQAHTRGLKIFGATLTPFYGAAYYTEVGETKRQALNEWIRTGKAYDAVIDFDAVTRDPGNPKRPNNQWGSVGRYCATDRICRCAGSLRQDGLFHDKSLET